MSYKTLEELVLSVHGDLRLVPGTSVQVYNEDHTKRLIQEAYKTFAREPGFWWPQFMDDVIITPDGVTGKPTTDFNPVDKPWQVKHEDIRAVFPGTSGWSGRQLSEWSNERNSTSTSYVGGGPAQYVQFIADPYKLFRIIPITSTESFTVHRRLIPVVVLATDLVLIDDDVITNHVAWRLTTGNGANPSNGALFLNMFEAAYNRMKSARGNLPRDLTGGAGIPTEWTEGAPI